MSAIKLFKLDTIDDGTERFQTQLELGKDTCSFVKRKDGKMYSWGWKPERGHGFHEYTGEFEIVENIEDMRMQEL